MFKLLEEVIKISDLKVLGVKVKQNVYDEFKRLDGDVSTNLRRAISNYIKHTNETRLTTVNDKNKMNEYETLANELESFKENLSRFNQSLNEYEDEIPPIFQLIVDLTGFQLELLGLLESFFNIHLHDEEDQGQQEIKKDIWEEG